MWLTCALGLIFALCVPCSTALLAVTMVSKENQKFIKKVEAWAYGKFGGGSGDPEVEDAVDVFDYFTERFGQQLPVFHARLRDDALRLEKPSEKPRPGVLRGSPQKDWFQGSLATRVVRARGSE